MMNTTQLTTVRDILRSVLCYVRAQASKAEGLCGQYEATCLERRIQNAKSLIGTEIATQVSRPYSHTLEFKEGCTYLFVVSGIPKFTLDDWGAADTTYHFMVGQGYDHLVVIPVTSNPADDDALDEVMGTDTSNWIA